MGENEKKMIYFGSWNILQKKRNVPDIQTILIGNPCSRIF